MLSEHEEQIIAQFERQFCEPEDTSPQQTLSAERIVQIGIVGCVAGFAIMLLSLAISVPLSFAGFLMMFASSYWVSIGVREGGWNTLVERYRKPTPRRRSTDL